VSDRDLIVALDVGTTKVLTLVGSCAGERLHILGFGHAPSTGLRKGIVVDIPETAASIRASVDAAERATHARVGSVLVSLSGEHLASVNSRGGVALGEAREVTEEDTRHARRAARQIVHPPEQLILHSIPRQYALDGQDGVRHPVGMSATYVEVETHVVTAAGSFVENLAKCVHRAHLDVEEVIAAPLASGLAVATEAERALGVAVIDLGGGATHLALFRDGSAFHTAALPIGGEHLSYDLSVGLRITRDAGERLKRASGCARAEDVGPDEYVAIQQVGEAEPREVPRRLVGEILEPRVTELARLVREQVERATEGTVLPASAVLTGGGSLLPGLRESFAEILGIPARLGLPRHVEAQDAILDSPAAATGVGLVQLGAIRRGRGQPDGGWSAGIFQRLGRWLGGRRT